MVSKYTIYVTIDTFPDLVAKYISIIDSGVVSLQCDELQWISNRR